MYEIRVIKSADAHEDEVAACVAAIRCLLEHEAIDKGLPAPGAANAWRSAGLLQSVAGIDRISDPLAKLPAPGSLWRWRNSAKILTVLALCSYGALAPPARAQDAAMPPPVVTRPPLPQIAQAPAATAVSPTVAAQQNNGAAAGLLPPLAPTMRQPAPAPATPSPFAPAPGDANAPLPPVAPNSALLPPATTTIRVLLATAKADLSVSLPKGAILRDAVTGDIMAELPPQSDWRILLRSPSGYPQLSFSTGSASSPVLLATHDDYRHVSYGGDAAPSAPHMVAIPPGVMPRFWLPASRRGTAGDAIGRIYSIEPQVPDGTFALAGKNFRGQLFIRPNPTGSFDIVNTLNVEDYLKSVVPSEMPSRWPLEALKAQAIAARSYAVAAIGKHESSGYDVKATIEDQVYAGASAESPLTDNAVDATRGEVLLYQGNVISAYFHSASGGFTEVAENVWSRPIPYLRAVADYDDESPYFSWSRPFTIEQMEQTLSRSGKSVGSLLALLPIARGVSPRVHWLLAVGTERSIIISGEEARKYFALPSTCFNVCSSENSYVFAGRGFGHGLGMSQWGARRLAEAGYSANDIVNYYYNNISVERL